MMKFGFEIIMEGQFLFRQDNCTLPYHFYTISYKGSHRNTCNQCWIWGKWVAVILKGISPSEHIPNWIEQSIALWHFLIWHQFSFAKVSFFVQTLSFSIITQSFFHDTDSRKELDFRLLLNRWKVPHCWYQWILISFFLQPAIVWEKSQAISGYLGWACEHFCQKSNWFQSEQWTCATAPLLCWVTSLYF
jgi:hypothetical protein